MKSKNVEKEAKAYSLDAIDFAKNQFDLILDWSNDSIIHIKEMLTAFHNSLSQAEPSKEQIDGFLQLITQ